MRHTKIFISMLAMGALTRPFAANAEAFTYVFSGTVTNTSGIYSSVALGTTVTGTYTFDLANGIPGQSVSTTSAWGIHGQSADVFSSTARVDQFSYATDISAGPGPLGNNNAVSGQPSFSPGKNIYEGFEIVYGGGGPCYMGFCYMGSSFLLSAGTNPYTSGGLPLFSAGTSGVGGFGGANGTLGYKITTLVAAPEIDPSSALSALTLLAGVMAVIRGRRRGGFK